MQLTRTRSPAVAAWLTIIAFAGLPTLGLLAGPSYAGLIFGLGGAQVVLLVAVERRFPAVDRNLALLAAAFAALCWASIAWSVDPARSPGTALQVTVVLAGALLFLAGPRPDADQVERLFRVLAVATVVGTLVFIVDALLHYPLQALLTGRPPEAAGYKYNRGVDYLLLIAWPVLGFVAGRRDVRVGAVLVACLLGTTLLSLSLAAKVAAVAAVFVFIVACGLPRIVGPLLIGGMVLQTAALPFLLNLLAERRQMLGPHLKFSGLHRLEIWDFMTARVLERPVLGWGIGAASKVPMPQEELGRYVILRGDGIYPHDQWLQLWVETGAVGAAIGLTFALLVLYRIRRLPASVLPFAYAAFTGAFVISSVNFEVQTDSWWAALAACGYLLRTLDAALPADRA